MVCYRNQKNLRICTSNLSATVDNDNEWNVTFTVQFRSKCCVCNHIIYYMNCSCSETNKKEKKNRRNSDFISTKLIFRTFLTISTRDHRPNEKKKKKKRYSTNLITNGVTFFSVCLSTQANKCAAVARNFTESLSFYTLSIHCTRIHTI